MELIAEREALAEFELDAAARIGGLEADHVPLHRAALGRATADDAADAVLGHKVKGAVGAALDRLPAFDGQTLGGGHQRDFLQRVAAIRHFRRDRVELAFMRKRLPLESLEQDLHAFFEHLAVGILVEEWGAEGLDLAGVIAPPDPKNDPPAGQDVSQRIVFGET